MSHNAFPSWAVTFIEWSVQILNVQLNHFICWCTHKIIKQIKIYSVERGWLLSPLLNSLHKGNSYSDFYSPRVFLPVLDHHINGIVQHILFYVWFFPSVIFFFNIDKVFVWSYGSFYFITVPYSIMWVYHNLFLSSVDGHLGRVASYFFPMEGILI